GGMQVIAAPNARYPPAGSALRAARLVLTSLDELTVQAIAGLDDSSCRAPRNRDHDRCPGGGGNWNTERVGVPPKVVRHKVPAACCEHLAGTVVSSATRACAAARPAAWRGACPALRIVAGPRRQSWAGTAVGAPS